MKEEFVAVCKNTTKSFNAIIQALQLSKVVDSSKVTRLLSFIDSIIDYYLQLNKQETIRYPIVYIPCAKDWAEEVCIEYVYYKMVSTFDVERINTLREESDFINNRIVIPEGWGGKKAGKYRDNVRKVREIVSTAICAETDVRNLIVCGKSVYNRIRKKQLLMRFSGESPKTSITYSDVITTRKQHTDYKEFENIFCFYSGNGVCEKYEVGSLFNWTRLKNCFIFEFDYAPYCLHTVLNKGERLCNKFPHHQLLSKERNNIYPDFITLTAEEAHYLFNEEPQNSHTIIHFPEIIEEDKDYIIDLYKSEWGLSNKERALLSLCLCQEAKDVYIKYLRQEKPLLFDDSYDGGQFLDIILQNLHEQEVIDNIMSFAGKDTEVAFVLGYSIDPLISIVKELFAGKNLRINFYHYRDLRGQTITEKKIVMLCFRPFKYYNQWKQCYSFNRPNSFDEFSLNNDQLVLDIINEMAIIDYCKFKYDYDLLLYDTTKSQFRREALGGELDKPQNPCVQYVSHYSELDDDSEQIQTNTIPTIKVEFLDDTSVPLPENEILICENSNGENFIKRIRELKEQNLLHQIKAIQPICELADTTMDVFFEDGRRTTSEMENKLRQRRVEQGDIPENHNQQVPIWKFLLERKVRNYCKNNGLIQDNQNDALWLLLRNKLNDERIQKLYKQMGVRVQLDTVLKNWCDITMVEPLAPGRRKDRENLIVKYLGAIEEFLLYKRKQLLTRDMTRTRNRITEGFLGRILFDDITDELAMELLEDSQYTEYLVIETKEDIETLKAIALEHINLKQIKSFTI